MLLFIITALLCARGLLILFTNDSTAEWSNLLGIGGLGAADTQFGALGSLLRVAQLIEGRLWILVAFPVAFRLPWGRDVAILVAVLGMIVQSVRLLAGNGAFAVVWLVVFLAVAALFYAEPGIRAYFARPMTTDTKP